MKKRTRGGGNCCKGFTAAMVHFPWQNEADGICGRLCVSYFGKWGHGANLDILESKLASYTSNTIKAICTVHNETATGVTNNLAKVRQLLALTESQKALSLPTRMCIVCASPKALEASKTAKSVRVFFDWKDYLKFYQLVTYWPYTPSIQLVYGLRAALDLLFEEGLENVISRQKLLGTATGVEIVRRAWKRYNVNLGLGLNKVVGKVFRIGHLGNLNELQLLGCLACVEMILKNASYHVKLGSGVAVASAYLENNIHMILSRI
ncbi:hypothetical protein PIB30_065002 [Stylosanthes scabra]|uniref:Uncharacterized protein n=1 Tax=Stylosanthes scabra TaxID=79078 RepID=A0ABU6TLM4_9FABA|nr:hypothetical protein [Stylosanthes scabra]